MSDVPIDVRALRKRLGWNQQRLAAYLGVVHTTVSRMETSGEISGPIRKLLLRLQGDLVSGVVTPERDNHLSPTETTGDEA